MKVDGETVCRKAQSLVLMVMSTLTMIKECPNLAGLVTSTWLTKAFVRIRRHSCTVPIDSRQLMASRLRERPHGGLGALVWSRSKTRRTLAMSPSWPTVRDNSLVDHLHCFGIFAQHLDLVILCLAARNPQGQWVVTDSCPASIFGRKRLHGSVREIRRTTRPLVMQLASG